MELLEYKILLEKYYEGTSSIEEEKELSVFLQSYRGDDVEFRQASLLFDTLNKDNRQTVNIDFDLLVSKGPNFALARFYKVVGGIAASLVIGLSLLFLLNTNKSPIVYAYINGQPITNKQIAIDHSKQALAIISSELNRGTNNLNYINNINKPTELLTNK